MISKDFNIRIFGSTANGLACKGSDVDMTLLLNSYFPDNQHKQQMLPKMLAKQQLNKSKLLSPSKNSSNSNSTVELLEEEVEEDVVEDIEDEEENKQAINGDKKSDDSSLKEAIVKFFVRNIYIENMQPKP